MATNANAFADLIPASSTSAGSPSAGTNPFGDLIPRATASTAPPQPAKPASSDIETAVVPLTEERFQRYVKPYLDNGYASTAAQYQQKHPDATHIKIFKHGPAGEWLPGRVGTAEALAGKGAQQSQPSDDTKRSAFVDVPLQAVGGVRDAVQEILDLKICLARLHRPIRGTGPREH